MNVNLVIYFDYNRKPEHKRDRKVSDLLESFCDFCEDTSFRFQSIPRVGEHICAEPIVKQWIANKRYKKPCSDSQAQTKIYHALRTGHFTVEEIWHYPDVCSIHCSDIEYGTTG